MRRRSPSQRRKRETKVGPNTHQPQVEMLPDGSQTVKFKEHDLVQLGIPRGLRPNRGTHYKGGDNYSINFEDGTQIPVHLAKKSFDIGAVSSSVEHKGVKNQSWARAGGPAMSWQDIKAQLNISVPAGDPWATHIPQPTVEE